jgi:flagellar hook-associated protein 3 FlgL
MRITDQMMFQMSVAGADRATEQASKAQQQVSSGLAFTHPGDAPAAAGEAVRANANVQQFTAIGAAITTVSQQLQTADGALNSVSNELNQATQVAEQLANATYNASDRAAGAAQINGIISTIIGQLNSQQGSTYLFGGTADSAPPFDSTGTFSGNTQSKQIEVAPGVYQDVSVNVASVMTAANGGADVLGTLQSLATALSSNDTAGIEAALDPLQKGVNALASTRGQLSATVSVLNAASTASQSAQTAAQTQASSLTSADVIQASSNLALAQQALQAALAAASQSFQFTLVGQMK